jgi:hypothetical protein
MNADVCNVSSGPHQVRSKLERSRRANGFDGDVCTKSVSEFANRSKRVLTPVVDGYVCTELRRGVETRVNEVDRYNVTWAIEPSSHDRRESDWP